VITNLEDAQQYLAEDSYLQLVLVPADGMLTFTAEQGWLAYVSELAKVPIPREGAFTFQVADLEPGTYIIAAQQFLSVPGSSPLLVREAEPVTIVIPEHANLPLSFDLGEVAIYIP
jgi:hypothetical protein